MKKLNAFQIKIFALVLMLMDHLYFAFPKVFPLWFHPLSRVVSPIFAFLLVEGFFHTRNRFKYNVRLFGWAIFMMLGNKVLSIALGSKNVHVGNNIFMTLAVGFTIIHIIEFSKKKEGIGKVLLIILSVIIMGLGFVTTEGGNIVLPFILITYLFRGNIKKSTISYTILSIVLLWISYTTYPTLSETINMLMFNSDFLFILVIPFIILYNGERGPNNKFTKYLFYIFYPLHLWLLAIIAFLVR